MNDQHMIDTMTARAAILDELKRRYQSGDKAVQPNERWTSPYLEESIPQKNYYTGMGEMPCPICKTGTLRYMRSSYNGHVHGSCSTDGCVRWME